MDGHRDGISCMAKNPNYLKGIFSASMDGGKLSTSCFFQVLTLLETLGMI